MDSLLQTETILELLDRPAFLVKSGKIAARNQTAKNRQIPHGEDIANMIADDNTDYAAFTGGLLHMTVWIGMISCRATVTKFADGDLFLLDRDFESAQLQALALAAQQLRTPLSNVICITDDLLPELAGIPGKNLQEHIMQINRGLFQMQRIINNMADAQRFAATPEPILEMTDFTGFFREIVDGIIPVAEHGSIHLVYSDQPKRIIGLADRDLLQRAAHNMLSNALKFSEKGSSIEVSLQCTKKRLCFSVQDHGSGIPPHAQGFLFSRYQREPGIEDSRFGLGLGMTIIQGAAATHGGTVLVEQLNDGTRVTLSIRLTKDNTFHLRSPQIRISDYAGGRNKALLEFSETLPASAYNDF